MSQTRFLVLGAVISAAAFICPYKAWEQIFGHNAAVMKSMMIMLPLIAGWFLDLVYNSSKAKAEPHIRTVDVTNAELIRITPNQSSHYMSSKH
jgi:ABC-type tungstate transport system substrate-binding protein